MKRTSKIKKFVKERYAKIAAKEDSCCPGCGCSDTMEQAKSIGYNEQEIRGVPEAAVMGLGCGNPTAMAGLKEGETVLDLGCGGGLDVFLASKRVGVHGRVIGVDMTPEMIEKARENAKNEKYKNVEFRLGEIEKLPVKDNSVDVIISNCVINLSEDKLSTFKEACRVLKPGGRMFVSDIVTRGELPEEIKRSFEAWAGCVAGAMERQEYLDTIKKAGFRDIAVTSERAYDEKGMNNKIKGKIISIQIKARKSDAVFQK